MKQSNKKTFVLDTNVILHDYHSIFNFEENEIILKQTKRIHQYNISALEYDIIYDKEKKKYFYFIDRK